MTVRELVREIQREVREPNLLPARAAELLVKLTALLGNIADEIREADMQYAELLLKFLETEEAVSRAKVRAEVSPEYRRKREARDVKELAIELIRSLKVFVRAAEEEMRLTR